MFEFSLKNWIAQILRSPYFWIVAYLLRPTKIPWGVLSGLPFGGWGLAFFLLLLWNVFWGKPFKPTFFWIWILVAATKLLLAPWLLERGFVATYYPNETFTSPNAKSTIYANRAYTRIDEQLSFGEGRQLFPRYFFWDNPSILSLPERKGFGFSVEWTGWVRIEDEAAELYFESPKTTKLRLDGERWINSGPTPIGQGWHSVEIQYVRQKGESDRFEAGVIVAGEKTALGTENLSVYQKSHSEGALKLDKVVRLVATAVDLFLCLTLLLISLRTLSHCTKQIRTRQCASSIFGILFLCFGIYTITRAWPLLNYPFVFEGGHDWLAYIGAARDILINGPLMLLGKPLGQAGTFYNQPFYPYFLALLQLFTGEDLFGIYVIQQFMMYGIVAMGFSFGRAAFGVPVGVLSAICLCGLIQNMRGQGINMEPMHMESALLTESLFLPAIFAFFVFLAKYFVSPRRISFLVAISILAGICLITRNTIGPTLAFVVCLMWFFLKRKMDTLFFVLVVSLLVGCCTLRNWIAANQFVLLNSYGSVNLAVANVPPPEVDLSKTKTRTLYKYINFNDFVRPVVEFAIQAPGTLVAHWWRRAWDNLVHPPFRKEAWLFIFVWVSALGLVFLPRGGVRLGVKKQYWVWIPLFTALSHFAVLTVVSTHSYGNRMLYSVYFPLSFYASIFWVELWQKIRRRFV